MRLRFAPSPTGHLHVGNVRTALFNWLMARGGGGAFVLRIEDTDVERSAAAWEASIVHDLRWLGLDWDEGPDIGGPFGPYRSSERLEIYATHAQVLLNHDRAYYCFCSTEQLEADRQAALAAGQPVRYSGRCRAVTHEEAHRRVAAGQRPAIRFRVPDGRDVIVADAVRGEVRFHTDVIGDPAIVRADGSPAYNFAVVVDDALMGITHVIRGDDHISNTPRQILLYEALGFRQPTFGHVALVMGPDHSPLSKRHGATSVDEFRSKGYLPEALLNYLALLGWSPRGSRGGGSELMPASELARRFSLADVVASAGVFDEDKLAWVNRHYLKEASAARLAELSIRHFRAAGIGLTPDARAREFLASTMPMVSASVDRLDQVPGRLAFLFDFSPAAALGAPAIAREMTTSEARAVVGALAERLAAAPRLDRDRFRAVVNDIRQHTGQKGRALLHPIRIALTGRAEGPELDLAVPAIDRGAELPAGAGMPTVIGCRERAAAFAGALDAMAR